MTIGTVAVIVGLGERAADERVKALEVGPRGNVAAVGLHDFGLLDLVLLFGGVDSVFALDVGATELGRRGVLGVDGVGDLLPVFLAEVSPVQLKVVGTPGIN